MSSTNKTVHYDLNDWIGTDKPTRADFARDNYIIDAALFMHTADGTQHLTHSEKARVSQPCVIRVVQGDDAAQRTIDYDFSPSLVVCCAFDMPPVCVENGETVVRFCMAFSGSGGSASCALGNTSFILKHRTVDGVRYDLNSSDCQYIIAAFR